jgi:hypothetical protein
MRNLFATYYLPLVVVRPPCDTKKTTDQCLLNVLQLVRVFSILQPLLRSEPRH